MEYGSRLVALGTPVLGGPSHSAGKTVDVARNWSTGTQGSEQPPAQSLSRVPAPRLVETKPEVAHPFLFATTVIPGRVSSRVAVTYRISMRCACSGRLHGDRCGVLNRREQLERSGISLILLFQAKRRTRARLPTVPVRVATVEFASPASGPRPVARSRVAPAELSTLAMFISVTILKPSRSSVWLDELPPSTLQRGRSADARPPAAQSS